MTTEHYQHFRNRRALIIGMGLSGRSAAKFLLAQGASVVGVDRNREMLSHHPEIEDLRKNGLVTSVEGDPLDLRRFQLLILSPGIPATHPTVLEAQKLGIEILGEIELACRFLKQKCLGITGTNGKTTVTLLVEHVLNRSGKPAKALGNVEVPLAAALTEKGIQDKILVLELSSYQLETMLCQILDGAVILNITPDHLDRYGSMESYAKAKMCIQDCLKPGRPLFLEKRAFDDYGYLLKGSQVSLYGDDAACDLVFDQGKVSLKGKLAYTLPEKQINHDLENQMAAFALCQTMGVTGEQFLEALKSFKKPSHRVEFVRSVRGIAFYDDSKGTNVDAVIKAVKLLQGNIILIAGGVDKGAPYTSWIEAFEGRVKGICAIGEAAPKIEKELSSAIPLKRCHSLENAVALAAQWAQQGETVLLSPGCSSFDMFRDYKHRGEVFQQLVQQLQ